MKKERTILILENIITLLNDERFFIYGICSILTHLIDNNIIDEKERNQLKELLNTNKPSKHNEFKDFYGNEYWVGMTHPKYSIFAGYWWQPMYDALETRQIRIDYLTKLITNIK